MEFLEAGSFCGVSAGRAARCVTFLPRTQHRSLRSRPRAARGQKQLLPSGRESGWKVPGMTQIAGRSCLPLARSKGLRVDRAECCLGCPSPIHPAPAALAAAWSMALASPGASQLPGCCLGSFLIPGGCAGRSCGVGNQRYGVVLPLCSIPEMLHSRSSPAAPLGQEQLGCRARGEHGPRVWATDLGWSRLCRGSARGTDMVVLLISDHSQLLPAAGGSRAARRVQLPHPHRGEASPGVRRP